MGMLLDGSWVNDDPEMTGQGGTFQRPHSTFRAAIGDADHPAEAGRYHLFTAPTCPWAHRTLIARRIKKLEAIISVTEADQPKHQGWTFSDGIDDLQPVNGKLYLHQVYSTVVPDFTGRVTVPVLWDRKTHSIVNNESSDILRMLDSAFNDIAPASFDYYPAPLREQIDALNSTLYDTINNGVYRCGFAKSQEAYDAAFDALFSALDTLDDRLGRSRYLIGDQITECDIRLFTTLVRFDAVYVSHFKCNRNRISDFEHLGQYLRDLYQTPGFGDTVDMPQIKRGYFAEHRHINPTGIIPQGPALDFTAPHDRAQMSSAA
ncbi:glutathione S-transferase family protein [Paracoccus sp. Z330]|uniref:Glutathione S-transferase family protein n=1 Tax=Paracoccus onchidii TaxID=3017813 RepID=A0ABT4ZJZ6_9RHOB|nr:glutathione S-transferase family protein [Paracoccus onchidii]MDB6179643.1 glutathione S-transferase family protein [Paracoccus onchidii]